MAYVCIIIFAEGFTKSSGCCMKLLFADCSHKHSVFAALVTPIMTEALIKEGRNHPQGTKKQQAV